MKKFNTLKVRRERAGEFYHGHDAYMAAVKNNFVKDKPPIVTGTVGCNNSVVNQILDKAYAARHGGFSAQQRAAQRIGGGL